MSRLTRAAVLGLALAIAACSDEPVAPQPEQPQRLFNVLEGDDPTPLARWRVGTPQVTSSATKLIGTQGGSINIAGFEIMVPQGALSRPTFITIRIPVESITLNRVWAEFGPHGIQFDRPVTIRLPYTGTTSEVDAGMHVLWYDGSSWVPLPTTLTSDGRLQAQTTHFSEYGTEEGETGKGITLAGGN